MKEKVDFQIIANLMAGKQDGRKKLDQLTSFLDKNNKTYDVLTVDHPTPISLLPDNEREVTDSLICLGGDGTVSESIGYILNHKKNLPLAIIPVGTANFIADSFGIINHKNDLSFLLKGKKIKVDVGLADYGKEKFYFMLGMGLGFEEKFLKISKEKLKTKMGIFSYILAALAELVSLKNIPVTIIVDGRKENKKICTLMVLNMLPKIFKIFPLFKNKLISENNGKLYLQYVEYKNYFRAWLGTLFLHILGSVNFGLVKTLSGKEFVFDSPIPTGTQIDGELRGNLPVKISVIPSGFEFCV